MGAAPGRSAPSGLDATEVEIHARLPLLGLLGPSVLVVHGHAMDEP